MNKNKSFDWSAPTTLLLGRFQPWHAGHRALFEAALRRTGQVLILVRDTYKENSETNPLTYDEVMGLIDKDIYEEYSSQYMIQVCPNITNIVYGRDVGYKIERVWLGEKTEAISATEIRKNEKEHERKEKQS